MYLLRIHSILSLIVMLFTASKISSQVNIDFVEYDLPNGLHVILSQDKTNPIVCVDIWYHVGSKDEKPDKTGFAHLFEHMMFQGSQNVGKTEHFKYVQEAGGTLNGSTTQDRTNYFETLPSGQLETALWLESDRMSTLKVNRENFDNQREVVKEEKRQNYDNVPYGNRFNYMFKLLYNNHPYNWIPIGSMDDLNRAVLSDAQNFYKKFYCPNNASIAIVGDIDIAETRTLVDKYFGTLKSSDPIIRSYPEIEFHGGEKTDTIYDNIQLPSVYAAYKIPGITTKENLCFELLSTILSNGRSSRLYKDIVYDKKLARTINTFNYGLELGGLFIISSGGYPRSDLSLIRKEVESVLDNLALENVTDWELQKAKNVYETNIENRTQTVRGKAELLNQYHTFFNNTPYVNSLIENVQEITAGEIRDAVKKYLTLDNRAVLYYFPKKTINENQNN